MSSESTDPDVTVVLAEAQLPRLLTQLHELIEAEDPRVIHIDRDQGVIMALRRSADVKVEFTEMSLSLLLQQEVISIVDALPGTDPYSLLTAAAQDRGLTPQRACAHPHANTLDLPGDTLWTDTVAPGNLLLVCQRQDRTWALLGTQL